MTSTGAGVLTSLKNKMQHLRDELEKYKDLYDEKCTELEEEKGKSAQVCVFKLFFAMCQSRTLKVLHILT